MTQEKPPVCDYEGSDYQARFWDQGERAYEDRVEAIALARLLPPAGKLLLEIGAGAGRNTPRYRNFERVVLLDYSRTQLQQAQERLRKSEGHPGERYTYVAADVYRLPFVHGLFDTATMIRVLHHIADAPLALQQIRQSLRPGAAFILEFANKRNFKSILRYALRRQKWSPFSLEPVEFVALNFDFHPAAVRAWLREAGFTIQRQLTVSHFRFGPLKRVAPLSLLVGLDSLAQWTGNAWQLTPSVFVGARASQELTGTAPFPGSAAGFFRCIECGLAPLAEEPGSLACPGCHARYAIRDGIYDFREPISGRERPGE
jgi:ubiquinone/menaquinone biosynthesis C-methylase UbiE